MSDIHVKHTATLNLRCSWNMNMNKEVMKDILFAHTLENLFLQCLAYL